MTKRKTVEGPLGFKMLEESARKLDGILAALPKDKKYEYRHKAATDTRAEVDQVQRVDVSRVTTAALDKDFEIVLPAGIELDDYRQNPIVLLGHDHDKPLGKCLWIKPDDTGLIAKTYYTPRPDQYQGEWLPDFAFEMVKADVLRGKSIGFLPLEIRDPEPAELEQHPALQTVVSRCILFEYSVVAVPCNPTALVESVGKGIGLEHWQWKVVGKIKPKKAPSKPQPKFYGSMADRVGDIHLDADKIAELALQRLVERWQV